MGQWLDSITGWLTLNPEWLAVAVFIVACVECLAIAGLIVPGTVLLFAIAALAGSGALSLSETLLLGFLGGLLGDAVSYFLGRHFHQNIRRLPGLRHHPEWMNGAETYFHKYGIASLLVGRFIGPLRPMLPMVAGMCDMPIPRFIGVSLLAGAGWCGVPATGLGHRCCHSPATARRLLATGRHCCRRPRRPAGPELEQQPARPSSRHLVDGLRKPDAVDRPVHWLPAPQ